MVSICAMLSKPSAESSGGSSEDTSTSSVEQVLDGVGVFGAVQAMDQSAAGIEVRGGCGIERGFEVSNQAVGRGFIGTRQALRRHLAGAHFADYLFPDLGIGGDFGEVAVF